MLNYKKLHWNNIKKENIKDSIFIFTIRVTHKSAQDLIYPGSFVFLRKIEDAQFYDAPISIMDVDTQENFIKVAIEVQGVKTKTITSLDEREKLLVRGPFWNGVLGLKNLKETKDSTCILIVRGIGQAPMVPVMKKLYAN